MLHSYKYLNFGAVSLFLKIGPQFMRNQCVTKKQGARSNAVHSAGHKGFSLIELLVVIAIISILGTLAVAGLSNASRSSKLTSTAQSVADQISLGRQIAASRNLPVEVRFYILPYFGMTTGGASLHRGMQLHALDGTNSVAVSRPVLFPERVIIRTDFLIPILSYTAWSNITTRWGSFAAGGYGYRTLTIRPNGMLSSGTTNNINDGNNGIMVQAWEQDAPCDSSAPMPSNYAIVQVNPITSKVTVLRP